MGRKRKMRSEKPTPINVCRKCGRILKDITEEYKGTDHIYFDKGRYTIDIPQGRLEGTSRYSCWHCGARLTDEQVQWMEERKG